MAGWRTLLGSRMSTWRGDRTRGDPDENASEEGASLTVVRVVFFPLCVRRFVVPASKDSNCHKLISYNLRDKVE